MSQVLSESNKTCDELQEIMRNELRAIYYYEKILKQQVHNDTSERRIYWFYEMVKEDKEFKSD